MGTHWGPEIRMGMNIGWVLYPWWVWIWGCTKHDGDGLVCYNLVGNYPLTSLAGRGWVSHSVNHKVMVHERPQTNKHEHKDFDSSTRSLATCKENEVVIVLCLTFLRRRQGHRGSRVVRGKKTWCRRRSRLWDSEGGGSTEYKRGRTQTASGLQGCNDDGLIVGARRADNLQASRLRLGLGNPWKPKLWFDFISFWKLRFLESNNWSVYYRYKKLGSSVFNFFFLVWFSDSRKNEQICITHKYIKSPK
jgi:hypothetical protein